MTREQAVEAVARAMCVYPWNDDPDEVVAGLGPQWHNYRNDADFILRALAEAGFAVVPAKQGTPPPEPTPWDPRMQQPGGGEASP
ncbi:hypothetical protein M0638_25135 [Roseomonas sp. NAR14]|uniref:Uncharacterized protein n=1 Tax=Roseomonas acroporae TaxID=2937791 RepID=A0A9X1YCJ5_9PROT|nr:hypothetical protein [Roseomonas acroporae]MCK8787656.1 hypothetical protein [Roseomonas acroporae]